MNPFSAGLITAVIATTALSIFVLGLKSRQKMHRFFVCYLLSIGWWAAFSAVQTLSNDPTVVSVAIRLMHWGAIFIAVFFLHFLFYFTQRISKKFLITCYSIAIAFLVINHTPLFLAGITKKEPFHWFMEAGPLYPGFILFFIFTWSYAVWILFKETINSQGAKKQQVKLLFIGSLIGYAGGSGAFIPVYDFKVPVLYPYGNFAIAIYVSIMTYAVVKYRFLDIEVLVRRTLVFAGLLTFVFGVFSAATLIVREFLSAYLRMGNGWSYAISLFLIVVGYDHIRSLLINLTDNYLFQKKYDYQKFLKEASRGMSRIKSLEHLLNLVVHFVTMKMRVENAGVLMRAESGDFELQYKRGYVENIPQGSIAWNHPLIQYFTTIKESIDLEQVRERQANPDAKLKGRFQDADFDYSEIKNKMEELKAACCIPSFLGQELRNILVLGSKKSGDYFTEEDHNVLLTLAQESAIAIENARLYDEQVNKSKELQRINAQLETARSSLLGALQETELANKRLQDTQAQLIHEQKMATLGRLAASVGHEVNNPLTILSMNVSRAILKYRKNSEAKISEILDIFTKMEQNINRIKAVVNTLTGLLKKSEKGKFEPLSLKLILEETLPLVQFQTYLDNLAGTEVEFIVPGNTPLIRGDLERLQEVFLNLFINAYHAMEGRPNPKITVTADVGEDGKFVAIHFNDTGKGMTEETAKRIFNYGFTTKPAGKGSGLGLYMCKYIIELHGGEIKVTSEVDKGTTFTLTLPIYEETGTNFADQEVRTA